MQRCRGAVRLRTSNQVSPAQMRQCELDRTLRKPGAIGQFGEAHLDAADGSLSRLGRQEEVHEECRGRAIVSDQVPKQDVCNVAIETDGSGHAGAFNAIAILAILEAPRAAA